MSYTELRPEVSNLFRRISKAIAAAVAGATATFASVVASDGNYRTAAVAAALAALGGFGVTYAAPANVRSAKR